MTNKKLVSIDESSLPTDWKALTLADVTEYIQRGKGPKYVEHSDLPVINQKCIRWFGIQKEHLKYVDPAQWNAWAPERYVRAGDILWNSTGTGTIGRAALIKNLTPEEKYVVDSHVTIVRPKGVEPKYIHYWIMSPAVQGSIEAMQSGSTNQVELSKSSVEALPIPVAPLDQQKRIVAEIEKQFSRLDEAVANLKRVKANLKRYKAAVLKAAVEGRLVADSTKPGNSKWERLPIGVAIESLDQGWSPQCENEPSKNDNDWAVMKTTAVQPLQYMDAENKRLPDKLKPRANLELMPGDLLITRAGPRSRVGVACLVRATRRRVMLCDKVYRLRTKQSVALSAYLELVLNSPDVVEAINELKTGISDSGVNLTQKRFQELLVPIPPVGEQERTLAEVDRRLSLLRETEAQVDASLQRAERLRQSILSRAFSGRLLSAGRSAA